MWTIDQILENPLAKNRFMAFARREHFDNEVEFVAAVADYRASPNRAKAYRIYSTFVAPESPKEANVGAVAQAIRAAGGLPEEAPGRVWRIRARFQNTPANLFNGADASVRVGVEGGRDRFVNTPAGADYINAPGVPNAPPAPPASDLPAPPAPDLPPPGLDDLSGDLGRAEQAAGGGDGIAGGPRAPDPAPGADPRRPERGGAGLGDGRDGARDEERKHDGDGRREQASGEK